jgi:hypothetical protein
VSKKEYTSKEAAVALLDRVKAKALEHMKKSESVKDDVLEKAAPQNQTAAEAADIKVPQPKAPKANEKTISRPKELKLKKFMEHRGEKALRKAEKAKAGK